MLYFFFVTFLLFFVFFEAEIQPAGLDVSALFAEFELYAQVVGRIGILDRFFFADFSLSDKLKEC